MTEQSRNYRPDIDGLRALAVLPVVLFHAGVPGFTGGFAGVDVFFVISGYLITGLLLQDLERGEFSLLDFYVRRVRRILPALVAVVAATLVLGFFLLTPQQFAATGAAARAAMTISANLHFAGIRADYWNQSELAEQPLLHTWSLAVEEQFYLLLPALLWLGHALGRRIMSAAHAVRMQFACLALLGLASFAWAQQLLDARPGDAFFLLLPRAWELLGGGLLAFAERRQPARDATGWRNAVGVAGLALLSASYVLLDEKMPFPGTAALMPCAGALMIIYGGGRADGFVRRILSWRPLVLVGLISYSLYLWHWPVLVYLRSAGWHGRLLPEVPIFLQLSLMLLLAWISWRFVEQPFRQRKGWSAYANGVRTLLGGSIAATLIWGVGAQASAIGEGRSSVAQAIPAVVDMLGTDLAATPGLRCEGADETSRILADGGGCMVGATGAQPTFALVGDSHARMFTEAVHELGKELQVPILVMARSSCVPALDIAPPTRKECKDLTQASIDYLLRSKVETVVLAGYWVDLAASDREASLLAAGLDKAVTELAGAGKRVFLLKDVPELPSDGAAAQAALESIRLRGDPVFGPSIAEHLAIQKRASKIVDRIARDRGAHILDPASVLCSEKGCKIADGSRTMYRDRHHLTDAAAVHVRNIFLPAIDEANRP